MGVLYVLSQLLDVGRWVLVLYCSRYPFVRFVECSVQAPCGSLVRGGSGYTILAQDPMAARRLLANPYPLPGSHLGPTSKRRLVNFTPTTTIVAVRCLLSYGLS